VAGPLSSLTVTNEDHAGSVPAVPVPASPVPARPAPAAAEAHTGVIASPAPDTRCRVVVLVSGSGTLLQSLIDACGDPGYGVDVVAVGADRHGIEALARATRAGIPTFVCAVPHFPSRLDWDEALTKTVAGHQPSLVVLAGFLKLTGPSFLREFGGRTINTHPALSPAFPGMHAPRDALAYGVKVTGCTVFVVDEGVDAGPIVEQVAVPVREGDDVASLHERIKVEERRLLADVVGRMARQGWSIEGRKVSIP